MPFHFHPAGTTQRSYEFYRRHPRILFSIPIKVRHCCPDGVCSTHGISLDVCEGGLGAMVEGEVYVGETVAIDFRLSDQPVTIVAMVRHTCDVRSGFEFVGLTPEERLQISDIVGHS